MIRVFVDTNVLLDFLGRREAFYRFARKLMTFEYMGKYELWMSASQATDIFYTLSNRGKPSLYGQARRSLEALLDHVHIVSVGEREVREALKSDIADYEDAFILSCAQRADADCIITRDEGLANGLISIKSPEEFFEWLGSKHHVGYAQMELVDGTWKQTL